MQAFSVVARVCFAPFIDIPINTTAPSTTANRVKIRLLVTTQRCVVRKSAKYDDYAVSSLFLALPLVLDLTHLCCFLHL